MIELIRISDPISIQIQPALFMNRRDDCAEPLLVMDSCEYGRSYAYGRLSKDSLRAKEQARARQYSCIMWVSDALESRNIRFRIDNTGMNALMPLPTVMDARVLVVEEDRVAAEQIVSDLELNV